MSETDPWDGDRFPLIDSTPAHFPKKPLCPQCRERRVFEPHSFAALSGGACLIDPETGDGGPDGRMQGFLDLTWHGGHGSGQGEHRERYSTLPLVRDAAGGQFDLYFCSTDCLRRFLNDCVDELERRRAAGDATATGS